MIWLILGTMTLAVSGLIVFSLLGKHEDGKHHLAGPILLSVLLPLAAFALYLLAGYPSLSSSYFHDFARDIAELEKRLASDNGDSSAWIALAKLYASSDRPIEAQKAWAEAARLKPGDLEVQLDYANFLLIQPNNKTLPPEFPALVQHIETLAPDHILTLFYKGLVAKFQGDKESALAHWQKLLANLPQDSPLRDILEKELGDLSP